MIAMLPALPALPPIRFADPIFLGFLLLLPLAAMLRGRIGKTAAVGYSSAELARSAGRPAQGGAGAWLFFARLFAAALLIVALARPQLDRGTTEVHASGIDLVLALDVSGSMESLDLKIDGRPTSRVEVVKSVVGKFIAARPDDRIALMIFAGKPYLVSPLTLDHDWLLQNLERVRIGIIEDSTAIGDAIAAGVNRLRDQPDKSKVMILLTDGQNNSGRIMPNTAAEAAKALGVKVYTIGIGVKGDAPFPVKDAFGNVHIEMIPNDVDEDALQKIADETGGRFFRATDTETLKHVYQQIDRLEKSTRVFKKFEHYEDLYTWVLIPALCLFGLELRLSHTRYRRVP